MQDPNSPLDTLRQLKEMLDAGALTPTEFEALKQRLVFGESSTAGLPPPVVPPASPVNSSLPAPGPFAPSTPPIPPMAEAAAAAAPFEYRPEAFRPTTADVVSPFPPASTELVFEPVLATAQAPVQPPLIQTVAEPFTEPVAEWPTPEAGDADVPPVRKSPLGLIIAVGAVLAFLAVVVYLTMSRPSSEHISSTSQTAADSTAATIETGPQAAPLPPSTTAAPETVRVAPAHPAPALPSRSVMAGKSAAVRDSAASVPAATDSTAE